MMFENKVRVDAVIGTEVNGEPFAEGVKSATGSISSLDAYVHHVNPCDVPELIASLLAEHQTRAFIGSADTLDSILGSLKKFGPAGTIAIGVPNRDKATYSVGPFLSVSQKPNFSPSLAVGVDNSEAAMRIAHNFASGKFAYASVVIAEADAVGSTSHVTNLRGALEQHHVSFYQKSPSEVGKNDVVLLPFHPHSRANHTIKTIDATLRRGTGVLIGIPRSDVYDQMEYSKVLQDTQTTGIVGANQQGSVLRLLGEFRARTDSPILGSVLRQQESALGEPQQGKTYHFGRGFGTEVIADSAELVN